MDLDELEAILDQSDLEEDELSQPKSLSQEREPVLTEGEKRKLEDDKIREEKVKEQKMVERKIMNAHEQVKRDDLTVIVINLNLKATEKDIWQFMSENCGKVREIHIVKDQSKRSKGIAYVEFYEQESKVRAFNISGRAYILGQPIMNRAAKVAKKHAAEILSVEGEMQVYVGGLTGSLKGIRKEELELLFTPFGPIVDIDFPIDPYIGQSRGYAFITFANASDGRDAIQAMNGFEIAHQQLKMGHMRGSVLQSEIRKAQAQQDADILQETRKLRHRAGETVKTNANLIQIENDDGQMISESKADIMKKLALGLDGKSKIL